MSTSYALGHFNTEASYEDRVAAEEQKIDMDTTIFVLKAAHMDQTYYDKKKGKPVTKTYNGNLPDVRTYYDTNSINRVLTSTDPSHHSLKLDLILKMIELQDLQRVEQPAPDDVRRYGILLNNLSEESIQALRGLDLKHKSTKYKFYAGFTKTLSPDAEKVSEGQIEAFVQQFLFDWANQPRLEDTNDYDFGGRLGNLGL